MISLHLAEQLADAGLQWRPRRGDHFVLPHKDMDADVFVLSDMTIEVHRFPAGEVIGFNGTVEWALDSIELHEALWLPREDQLREALGEDFVQLTHAGDGYGCTSRGPDGPATHCADTPSDAYALALLAKLRPGVRA